MERKTKEQKAIDRDFGGVWPTCKCGCGEKTKYNARRCTMSDYIQGHQARVYNPTRDNKEIAQKAIGKAHAARAKQIEEGTFTTWNSGKTKETDERVKTYGEKQVGKVRSDEEKRNISEGRKKYIEELKKDAEAYRQYNEHMREYWSKEENKLAQRKRTTDRLKAENYSMKTSSAERMLEIIMETFGLIFERQYDLQSKLFDFRVGNTLIEVDGNFHHADPKYFPDGPIYPIQIKTCNNDKLKNDIAKAEGYSLIRIWADSVVSDETMEIIKGLLA